MSGQVADLVTDIASGCPGAGTVVASLFAERRPAVPTYILLSSLTDDGLETIQTRPDRIKQVNEEIQAIGARVVEQWATLGPYDFVNIVEAPDNETIAKVSVMLGSRGTVKFLTMPAIPIDEFIAGLTPQDDGAPTG
jgi:uncharacterized protein with GYD domain